MDILNNKFYQNLLKYLNTNPNNTKSTWEPPNTEIFKVFSVLGSTKCDSLGTEAQLLLLLFTEADFVKITVVNSFSQSGLTVSFYPPKGLSIIYNYRKNFFFSCQWLNKKWYVNQNLGKIFRGRWSVNAAHSSSWEVLCFLTNDLNLSKIHQRERDM